MGKYELLLAFSAGTFTFLSPCAFLLPAYVSYYVGTNPEKSDLGGRAVLKKSLSFGGPVVLSIIMVFTVIGIAVGFLGELIKPLIPAFQGFAGVVFILMGLSLWKNSLTLPIPKLGNAKPNIFSFGILYSLAIVSCSAPIFVSLLSYALSVGGTITGITIFWVYSAGISLPLLAVTIVVAGANQIAVQKFTGALPVLRNLASLGLISVGVYLIYRYAKLAAL